MPAPAPSLMSNILGQASTAFTNFFSGLKSSVLEEFVENERRRNEANGNEDPLDVENSSAPLPTFYRAFLKPAKGFLSSIIDMFFNLFKGLFSAIGLGSLGETIVEAAGPLAKAVLEGENSDEAVNHLDRSLNITGRNPDAAPNFLETLMQSFVPGFTPALSAARSRASNNPQNGPAVSQDPNHRHSP